MLIMQEANKLCDVINLSTPFLWAFKHQFTNFSPFCKQFGDEKQIVKDKRKHHDAADKCSSEQHFCKSDISTFVVQKSEAIHLEQPGFISGS